MPSKSRSSNELPSLIQVHQLRNPSHAKKANRSEFWSIHFYPYTRPGDRPVFAMVGGNERDGSHILICRLPPSGKMEVIQYILDKDIYDETKDILYSCVFTKDMKTGAPLLCVAGTARIIKIIDVRTGKVVKSLCGHGGSINDLAISPLSPEILVSCSDDQSIIVWSLDPAHEKQPVVAILKGEAIKDKVYKIAFHQNGRYLLSAGGDCIVNLWTLPEFPDENTGKSKPTLIYFPHFSSPEVHQYQVDSITFFHDLILSRSEREDRLVLWSITGFDSTLPPPTESEAPSLKDEKTLTRSFFAPPAITPGASPQYSRLLTFANPKSELVWIRHGFFPGSPTTNSILACGNEVGELLFWDLARLSEHHEAITKGTYEDDEKRPGFMALSRKKTKGQNGREEMLERSRRKWDRRYGIGDPERGLEAHRTVDCDRSVCLRGVGWSADGRWCVAVGDQSTFVVYGWGA
ncbi:WD40-repeat-containing domain protein [Amylocarpus encephaloides]|uniref:WD40-repeat-containing domain protein n=1 Tax=Amylocarpus encephaloides TaxID=45428 RepID=A0A9P7YCI4_9HELO|nr:WD40-repeat-containing domain protein [Amylocarpus encephaloides]